MAGSDQANSPGIRARIPRWHGRITDDGSKIDLDALPLFRKWLQARAGHLVTLIVEPARRFRSGQQNAYWWGVVVPSVADHCGYLVTEYDAVHDELMRVLVGMREPANPLLPIRVSSRTLTTAEFAKLIEMAQIFAAEKLGLVLENPDPGWNQNRPGRKPNGQAKTPARQTASHH